MLLCACTYRVLCAHVLMCSCDYVPMLLRAGIMPWRIYVCQCLCSSGAGGTQRCDSLAQSGSLVDGLSRGTRAQRGAREAIACMFEGRRVVSPTWSSSRVLPMERACCFPEGGYLVFSCHLSRRPSELFVMVGYTTDDIRSQRPETPPQWRMLVRSSPGSVWVG